MKELIIKDKGTGLIESEEFWNDDLRVQIREEIWDPEKNCYVLS